MDDATYQEYLTLLSWSGEHTAGLGALLRDKGSPAALLEASDEQLADLPPVTQRGLAEASRHWPRARRQWPHRRTAGAAPGGDTFLPIGDARYPAALRAAPDPPPWLFCRGDPRCLDRPAVAIVGGRQASQAGLRAARSIARRLAGAGYVVCSGLALGIDAAAHRGALDAGQTVAVLASGLDRASPHRNRDLAREISASGCLVSELPYGTHPAKARFPRRNRIISGLCSATIIVEAGQPSGSLHTAVAALEQGRDVYTLPWSIFHAQGAGCLRLLRDGATPITCLDDLALFFPARAPATPVVDPAAAAPPADSLPAAAKAALAPVARQLLHAVGDGALSLEELHAVAALPIATLLDVLADLEIDGHLTRIDGLYQRS